MQAYVQTLLEDRSPNIKLWYYQFISWPSCSWLLVPCRIIVFISSRFLTLTLFLVSKWTYSPLVEPIAPTIFIVAFMQCIQSTYTRAEDTPVPLDICQNCCIINIWLRWRVTLSLTAWNHALVCQVNYRSIPVEEKRSDQWPVWSVRWINAIDTAWPSFRYRLVLNCK